MPSSRRLRASTAWGSVAESIVRAREEAPFLSKEDLLKRTSLSLTLMKKLEALGSLDGMQEENQMTLF